MENTIKTNEIETIRLSNRNEYRAIGSTLIYENKWFIVLESEKRIETRTEYDFDDEDYGSSIGKNIEYAVYDYTIGIANANNRQKIENDISNNINKMKCSEMYGDWMDGQERPSEAKEKRWKNIFEMQLTNV